MSPSSPISPEQVEAHAAQGYSLIDVARLLGAAKHEMSGEALINAFNVGVRRWKDNGSPIPPRVNDLIIQAVHGELKRRETTRAELREALGYGYGDINYAIEALMEQGLVEREDDSGGTSYFRSAGLPSPVAEKRDAASMRTIPVESVQTTTDKSPVVESPKVLEAHSNGNGREEAKISARRPIGNEGDNEISQQVDNANSNSGLVVNETSVEVKPNLCGCGRSRSHLGRCAYRRAQAGGDFSVSRPRPDTRHGPTYKELDLAEVERVMATEETVNAGARKLGMTTAQLYVRRQKDAVDEAVERGREMYYAPDPPDEVKQSSRIGRPQIIVDLSEMEELLADPDLSMGEVAKRLGVGRNTIYKRKDTDAEFKAAYERGLTRREQSCGNVATKAIQGEVVPLRERTTVTTEVVGGLKLREETQVRVSEMAQWEPERIAEFFDALAKVIEIPRRPMPKTIKRAWSKDFESDDSEDGITGLTMLYLVSLLHDGMEQHEKDAVWTLIQYIKRMQAAIEEAKA